MPGVLVQPSAYLGKEYSAMIDNVSSNGNNQIVAAVSGKKIRVLRFIATNDTAVNFRFRSGSSGYLSGYIYGADKAGAAHGGGFLFETVAGEALNLYLSAGSIPVGGVLTYVLV